MGTRRQAREYALQVLFQSDMNRNRLKQEACIDVLSEKKIDPETRAFTDALIFGVGENEAEINALIKKYTQNWAPDRIAVVDRNILRFSIFELLYLDDVPPRVTINEAIEIAKTFGSEDSGKFVNGVLDQIHRHILKEKSEKRAVDSSKESLLP